MCSAHWGLCWIATFWAPTLSLLWFYDSQRFVCIFFKKLVLHASLLKKESCKVTHDSLETDSRAVGIHFHTMSMRRNRLFPVKCVSLLCFEGSQDMGKLMRSSHRLERFGIALFAACTKLKAYRKTLGNCLWCCKEDLNALKMEKGSDAVGSWWVVVFAASGGGHWHGVHRPFCSPWLCSAGAGAAQHSILGAEATWGQWPNVLWLAVLLFVSLPFKYVVSQCPSST